MKKSTIRNALRECWVGLFMDGRNEHGTHLLPMQTCLMGDVDLIEDALNPTDGTAEQIFQDAERLGHVTSHCIITVWTAQGDVETGPYFEYEVMSELLTELFYGTPAEQEQAFLEAQEAGNYRELSNA